MKTQPQFDQNSTQNDEGLTIIECLLAIVIVTILIVAIGPVLAFAAATRIQARRVEQASEAARGYVDAVKNDALLKKQDRKLIPPISSTTLPSAVDTITATALDCPTSNAYCTTPARTANSAFYCVDLDDTAGCTAGSGKDLVIQASGYNPAVTVADTDADKSEKGYIMGVRVYRAFAFGKNIKLTAGGKNTDKSKNAKASVIAGGTGSFSNPLTEFTTEMVGKNTDYLDWKKRIQ